MNKIKIIGFFIIILFGVLAVLSGYIRYATKEHSNKMVTINEQKAFAQEISKNIFYMYKNQGLSIKELDKAMKEFFKDMDKKDEEQNSLSSIFTKRQKDKIITVWSKFYIEIQNFRNLTNTKHPYIKRILEKNIQDIYRTNRMLVSEFDELIFIYKVYFDDMQDRYKHIQYAIFFLIFVLSTYLFTQIKVVMEFMQKFLNTSKRIITNSSVKELETIEIKNQNGYIQNAADNFNYMVNKINTSIEYSIDSIEHTQQSIERIEKNIEDFFELLVEMDEKKNIDTQLPQKEDAIILTLEELMTANEHLIELKNDLKKLINSKA